MKTYVISGGAGFIGSNLARKLIKQGSRVFVLDDLSTGFKANLPAGAEFIRADLSKKNDIKKLKVNGPVHAVYHLAAQSSGEASFADPARDIEVNYLATHNILQWAEEKKAKRFVFASSMSVYGKGTPGHERVREDHPRKPASYYGANKLASEDLIRIFCANSRIKSTLFRLFNVYGPGQNMTNMRQGMVSIYMAFLMRHQPITVKGSLARFRDFIYVEDVIDAFIASENCPATYGEVFNLGTGIKTTVRELLAHMLRAYGHHHFKKWVKVSGSTPGDIPGIIATMDKFHRATSWRPRFGLSEGLKLMKNWADQTSGRWVKK